MAAGVSRTAVTPSRERSWFSFVLSTTVHGILVALALWLTRTPPQEQQEKREPEPSAEKREVRMVYLNPPPQPKPPPPPPPPKVVTPPPPPPKPATPTPPAVAPPPKKAQTTPEPDANAPPEAKRSDGAEPTDEKPDQPERSGTPEATPPPSELATRESAMESEARRIFGSPKKYTPEGVGPRATRPMEAYLPDHPEKCTTRAATRDSSGQPQFGTVVGKIYRQDNGKPLGGAALQMLGTPYVAFTDGTGEYRFRFDMSLVDNCRTQYVRVTAAGYESRLLVLVVGPNAVSEDVLLKRR
jgi:outer membrane biosynthesis protein TonB